MKFIGYRTLKTGIGASISIIIANELGLSYPAAAGIITILSIQSTRKKSVIIAIQRIFACILALILSSILFKLLGYNPIVFGVFILAFIPLAVRLNIEEGIVVSSVIVTHLLDKNSFSIDLIQNELKLIFIGVGIALLLNIYMPSIEKAIKQDQLYIEEKMKEILIKMAICLKEDYSLLEEDNLFKDLEEKLYYARKRAYKNLNNYVLLDGSYYVQYIEMRIKQFESIKRMKEHFQKFFVTYYQTIMISEFTEKVAYSIYEDNTAEDLLRDLDILRDVFKKMPLPSTREEFENRAMLFQFLNDMEQFLKDKNEFKKLTSVN
jgi:uncharacterized membrane protein YgaE (UPF0421/DUF939 family)